jgi:hypothetical protein
VLPSSALDATFTAVRSGAQRGVESGVFWMGRRSEVATVEAVLLPRGPGVEERPDRWRVTSEVYGVISRWALPRELSLLAWVHTHGRGVPARLSFADRTRSIRAPGVLAVVIGLGGDEKDSARWGWYVYDDGDYRMLADEERKWRIGLGSGKSTECWRASLEGMEEGLL